jgi:hypothetical protein
MAEKHPFKRPFVVVSKAPFVAGMRSPGEGQVIMLTEAQAVHAERLGEIRRIDEKAAKAAPKKQTPAAADGPGSGGDGGVQPAAGPAPAGDQGGADGAGGSGGGEAAASAVKRRKG